MVTVLDPGGGASTAFAAAAPASAAESATPSWWACCLLSRSLSRAAWAEDGFVATTALGSPPSGSLTRAAHATTTTPDNPSAPANSWGAETGRFSRGFRLCWPRGVFRSSVTAPNPRESSRESSTRRLRHRPVAMGSSSALQGVGKKDGAALGRPHNFGVRPSLGDQFGTGVLEFGGNAELTCVPRRRSSAMLSALSFLASGGIYDCEPVCSLPSSPLRWPRKDASPFVSVLDLRSSGTSCKTSISGEIPFAWIERPDGVK